MPARLGDGGALGSVSAFLPGEPPAAQFWPTIGPPVFFAWLGVDANGAAEACFSKSATDGIRLPAMSFKTPSICAQASKLLALISGFRAASRSRFCPLAVRFVKRRLLPFSARRLVFDALAILRLIEFFARQLP